ncbi:MAG: hypothetical protein CME07_00850 [Gemmatimonadetes bacterium]|nr:hypothetical protein [Gemmatimonadota bacterium]
MLAHDLSGYRRSAGRVELDELVVARFGQFALEAAPGRGLGHRRGRCGRRYGHGLRGLLHGRRGRRRHGRRHGHGLRGGRRGGRRHGGRERGRGGCGRSRLGGRGHGDRSGAIVATPTPTGDPGHGQGYQCAQRKPERPSEVRRSPADIHAHGDRSTGGDLANGGLRRVARNPQFRHFVQKRGGLQDGPVEHLVHRFAGQRMERDLHVPADHRLRLRRGDMKADPDLLRLVENQKR